MAAPYPLELAQLVAQAGDLYLYDVHKVLLCRNRFLGRCECGLIKFSALAYTK